MRPENFDEFVMEDPSMGIQSFMDWVQEHDDQWGFLNTLTPENLLHAALGMVCEAGEAGDNVKKYVRSLDPTNVAEWGDLNHLKHEVAVECVDVIIYMCKLLMMLGVSGNQFESVWFEKFRMLHQR